MWTGLFEPGRLLLHHISQPYINNDMASSLLVLVSDPLLNPISRLAPPDPRGPSRRCCPAHRLCSLLPASRLPRPRLQAASFCRWVGGPPPPRDVRPPLPVYLCTAAAGVPNVAGTAITIPRIHSPIVLTSFCALDYPHADPHLHRLYPLPRQLLKPLLLLPGRLGCQRLPPRSTGRLPRCRLLKPVHYYRDYHRPLPRDHPLPCLLLCLLLLPGRRFRQRVPCLGDGSLPRR